MRFLTLGFLVALMSACNSQGGPGPAASPNDLTGTGYEGLWIEKDEAQELRSTGKLNSLCAEVRKDPDATIMNVRLIANDGTTYVWDPDIGKRDELKMGTLSRSGSFAVAGLASNSLNNIAVHASVSGDDLKFTFGNGAGIDMEYLRSSATEVRQYYVAEAACRK